MAEIPSEHGIGHVDYFQTLLFLQVLGFTGNITGSPSSLRSSSTIDLKLGLEFPPPRFFMNMGGFEYFFDSGWYGLAISKLR